MITSLAGILSVNRFTPDADALVYYNALALSGNLTLQDGATITPFQLLVLLDRFLRDLKGEYNPAYSTSNIYSAAAFIKTNIGATAGQHKWNLVNPVDSDAAYRSIYSGSPTHNAWGILHNTGSYDNSKFNMNTLTNNNYTICAYLNGGAAQNAIAFGAHTSGGNGGTICYPRYGNTNSYFRAQSSTERTGGVFSGLGLIQMTSFNDGANKIRYTENTTVKLNATDTKTTLPSLEMWFGGQNNNGSLYAGSTFRFGYEALFNRSLTTTEELAHYNAVQALQTGLHRNV